MVLVDLDPVLDPHLPLPPCLPLVLPVILTYMWLNNLGTITQSHFTIRLLLTSVLNCGLISLLEISHMFPLIVVDHTSAEVKGWSIGLVTAIIDGESQTSKEVMDYVL